MGLLFDGIVMKIKKSSIKLIVLMISMLQTQNVIAEENSFVDCKNIPDALSHQYCITKQQKNINNCYLISDTDRQRMCLAYFENNKSHCLMVEDDNKKQQCLSNF